ncbi:GNAT family N-acetyltransferase [Fumia xinanensis]|uniref:GNAT family N-acetyltransferase n=1 Tax=Fumia xinanensis TaxID=2763659 RepID=A0A926I629_9FIRM|nr:GNAT family N-acetyltransferase [Fumia xinanensis]MBC8559485.1 GNAT family N-acetyltransferase [Fumia xinanensis]
MNTIINGRKYRFETKYQHNDTMRQSFDQLAQLCFDGLSLERWYQNGCWTENSVPYTLFDGKRAVSNILIHRMEFLLDEKRRCFVQLGTVMTHPNYRGQGLLRFLMERVLHDWKDVCDGLFLYANETVLDFYPKFGFTQSVEWGAQKPVAPKKGNIRMLNLAYPEDRALFLRKSQIPNPFSALAVVGNSTIQFHCDYFLPHGVYYLEDFDAVAVAEREGNTLTCYDIFCRGGSLDEILAVLAAPGTNSVKLGFSPNDASGFEMIPVSEGDEPFVIAKDKNGIFGGKKLRFPLLSHT